MNRWICLEETSGNENGYCKRTGKTEELPESVSDCEEVRHWNRQGRA